MKKLLDRDEAFKSFLAARSKVNASLDYIRGEKSFTVVFSQFKTQASKGDAIAQDIVAYYYKNGVKYFLDENFTKYLKWEILAGANGNSFAIEKLQFLFGYAYDTIVDHEDFPQIKYYNDIDEYNYIYIIGQVICDKLVKFLELDEKSLALEKDEGDEYRPEVFRDFRKAIDACLDDVISTMRERR